MPKPMYVWTGTAWVSVASEVESLATYATQSYADNLPGIKMVVPSSVAVGSGSGSVSTQGTVTFSGASSISVNGCFSSTYDNYLINVTITAVTTATDADINFRLRASGTDTSSNYSRHYQVWNPTAATVATGISNQSEVYWITGIGTSNPNSFGEIRLFNPNVASVTSMSLNSYAVSNTPSQRTVIGNYQQTGSTQFDGFTFYLGSAGTITGKVRVYGLKNG